MIKFIEKIKKAKEARKNLKKYKQYYKVVKSGLLFIQFIQQDIADQKKKKINRAQRRRFEKELSKGGKLTEEIVQHYKMKIDNVLGYIEMELHPPKIKKMKQTIGTDVSKNLNESGASKGRPVDPNARNPFVEDDALKAEYKLIQEKKSNLPANERKKVVSIYEKRFVTK